MKYLSLFSGIGGFELGIQKAFDGSVGSQETRGHRMGNDVGPRNNDHSEISREQPLRSICVGYSEIDKYADQIYQKHFGGRNYGDATKINARELPDFDLLVGGFPCQAFSIAGKRKGFDDTRGTLFFDIARILSEKRPRHLVLENVKGLLSHDNGKTFQTILRVLADLGYFVEWQVLNSKDFGVPQNRERVFIVGHLGGEPRRKVFPIFGTNGADTFTRTVRAGGAASASEKHARDLIQMNQPKHSNDRVYSKSGVSPTLNTAQGGNRQPFIAPVLTPDRTVKRQNGARIRRLTPLECERLQGFPDGWTEGLSDTQRYKTLGNAVTVNVVEAVITNLMKGAK